MAQEEKAAPSNGHANGEKPKEEQPQTSDKAEKPKKDDQPAGGYDATPLPHVPQGYTLKITFHSATNLPMADFGSRTSDPFIDATLKHSVPTRHKEDPPITFRTPTIHRTVEPKWETTWIIGNVPGGSTLKLHIMDEDPEDHDDRLGHVHIHLPSSIGEGYKGFQRQDFELKKSAASWRAYGFRWLAVGCGGKKLHGSICLSIENLGKTEGGQGQPYTIGPSNWCQHASPLIGRMVKTEADNDDGGPKRYDFEANQIQLAGPVPAELYHRYVEFKSFVKGMFSRVGLRGRTLHWLLHHQHNKIYQFNPNTKYGCIDKPSEELSLQFLKMVHFDEGGRLFTYVLTLDGLFRFTETGKEFGIDLLSKHTMHSDVQQYIACSGEFFIRRLAKPAEQEAKKPVDEQHSHAPEQLDDGPPKAKPPQDASQYELVIDNDSGTYRPKGDLLPLLQDFLRSNFKGLKVRTMTCDDDHLQNAKKQQRETKAKEGEGRVYLQDGNSSAGSLSSSDVSDLDDRVEAARRAHEENEAENGGVGDLIEKGREALTQPKQGVAKWAGA